MLKVYYLPILTIDTTEAVAGIDLIHDAILDCTEHPGIRKLLMDTTPDEHNAFKLLGVESRDPTQDEIDFYHQTVVITEPDPDTIRAEEILATSPTLITMPEIWELLRIICRRLGFPT